MKILVLGGTGAMGKPVVKILGARGHRVDVTTRKARNDKDDNIHYVVGNAHDMAFLENILNEKYDAILDFMVYKPEEFRDRYIKFLENTSQYVFLSSARVYADSPDALIEESSKRLLDISKDQEFLQTNEYSLAKAREENLLLKSDSRNWTIIRPYITYYDERLQLGVFEKETWLRRALAGKKIVFSRNIAEKYTTLTYGYDVALRIADLIGNPKAVGQVYQIATGKYIKWKDVLAVYLDTLEKELGKRPEVFMTEQCDPFTEKNNQYQVHCDREYNRKFSDAKIQQDTKETEPFMPAEKGLKMCLQNFLAGERQFTAPVNWKREGAMDKISGDRTPLKKIPGMKNKVKYVVYRYMK